MEEKLEKLIAQYEEAESHFNLAEDILDKPHLSHRHAKYETISYSLP